MSTLTPLLGPLSQFISGLAYPSVAARLEARMYATSNDWLCAAVAGLGHPLYPNYVAGLVPGLGEGRGIIVGQVKGAPMSEAAAANAAISHLWEVDDAHKGSMTHPGIVVLPTVLALAQTMPNPSVDRMRGAIVVGYEAMLRIGSFLGKAHYAVCHTTATAGTFGAAAAAAHMLELDPEATLWALGHAGTQAQGMWQFLDDRAEDAKAFHGATAVRNGLSAALLANAGIKGAAHILEGPRGLMAAWHITDADPHWLQPGEDLMIDEVTVKNWPTCGQMHTALDCAEALAGQILHGAQIEKVVVTVPKACIDIATNPSPATVAEAKFSTAFCVAATLLGQKPDMVGLNAQLMLSEAVRTLSAQTEVVEDPAFTAQFPKLRPAKVSVHLETGEVLEEQRTFRKGDPELFWQHGELLERAERILALAGRSEDLPLIDAFCSAFSRKDQATADLTIIAKLFQG